MATETFYIRGVANYAKVIGAPRLNTFTEEREWSIDVTPDDKGRALLKKLGVSGRLKDPKDDDPAERKESYLPFRQREFRPDGTKNDPIRIVDAENKPWDTRLIGNGSVVDVKFVVTPGKAGNKGVYIRAIRVLEHVPYVPQEFAPLDSDDEYFAKAAVEVDEKIPGPTILEELDELNDDIP